MNAASLKAADLFTGADFEDNLQAACAATAYVDVIVTRDKRGFYGIATKVLTPEELLKILS